MVQNLNRIVFRVQDPKGKTIGAGFLLSETLAVTCAHTVKDAKSQPGEAVSIRFDWDGSDHSATVLTEGWSPYQEYDIAFLSLEDSPVSLVAPVALGTAKHRENHNYLTLGYPEFGIVEARSPRGTLGLVVPVAGQNRLEIQGAGIAEGISGAPILDTNADRVVGMLTGFKDDSTQQMRHAYAIPADQITRHAKSTVAIKGLRLWPDAFGPVEWSNYLNHLIMTHSELELPDGRRTALEQIYVSLRADAMNAAERAAEHQLFIKDVNDLIMKSPGTPDPYTRHQVVSRAITQRPKMQMHNTRDWERILTTAAPQSINLAEVVQRHPVVVLLGDPGSGKTTLGRWLTLQHARALRDRRSEVQVPLDEVQVKAEENETTPGTHMVILGDSHLPIFVRIGAYAQARWPKDAPAEGNGLLFEDFIRTGKIDDRAKLPTSLPADAAGAICLEAIRDGRALLIMDGLDEVADPDQRRGVMYTLNEFIKSQDNTENLLVLTSRIVGYQFQPLTHLPHYTVEDMAEPAVRAFCRAWMGITQPPEAAAQAGQELADAIYKHGHPGVRELAGNPLLLTLLAQVYQESKTKTLPSRRVDLFEAALHLFYRRREHLWDKKQITELRLRRALGAVAFYIHANEPTGCTDAGQAAACLGSILTNEDQVKEILRVADEATGFLVSRGEGVYAFLHRALQEYFTAVYLVRDPEQVIQYLTTYALDPTWREPLALAIGLLSHVNYPTTDKKLLDKILTALLAVEDLVGDLVPRRELLLAAGLAECESMPQQPVQQAAENLLEVYARRNSAVMQKRIQLAFRELRRSQGAEAVREVIGAAILGPDYNIRWAAADLILKTEWFDPSFTVPLLQAWRTFDGPCGVFLAAVEKLSTTQPDSFTDVLLPFRAAVQEEPQIWATITNSTDWQAIVQALYLLPKSEFKSENILRDSPLTPALLAALRSDDESPEGLKDRLQGQLLPPGTPQSRDAALALTALGDESWIDAWLTNGGLRQSSHQLAAALARFFSDDYTRADERDSDLAGDLYVDRDSNIFGDRDYSIARELACELDLNLPRASVGALAHALDIAHAKAHQENLGIDIAHVHEINYGLNMALTNANNLARAIAITNNVARYIDALRNLAFSNAHIATLNLSLDLLSASIIDRDDTSTRSDVYNHALDRDRALASGHDLYQQTKAEFQEISILIRKNQERWADEPEVIDCLMRSQHSIEQLMIALDIPQLGILQRFFSALHESQPQSGAVQTEVPDISLDDIEVLVAALASADNPTRFAAVQSLKKPGLASEVGRTALESLAEQAAVTHSHPDVNTLLIWCLGQVEHDQPGWLEAWAAKLADQPEHNPAKTILSHVDNIQLSSAHVLLDLLPHPSEAVNLALLNSLRWLESPKPLPIGWFPDTLQKLAAWRQDTMQKLVAWWQLEPNPKTQSALLAVLSHWRISTASAGAAVLAKQPHQEAYKDWLTALARLSVLNKAMQADTLPILKAGLPEPCAAAALVRLEAALVRAPLPLDHHDSPKERLEKHALKGKALLTKLQNTDLELVALFTALLDAGVDDDAWQDSYHGVLAAAAASLVCEQPENLGQLLLKNLLHRLNNAITSQGWPQRRIALAAAAACAEQMPTLLQQVAGGPLHLEQLLIQGSQDYESYNSRRFAIQALGYLRRVTLDVVPVLIAGFRENIEIVQQDAIRSAGHFQQVEAEVIESFIPHLTGESLVTAYGVARLLGAVGISPAADVAILRPRILTALVEAIRHPNSQKEVKMLKNNEELETKGMLVDTLYEELLRVTGWL